MPEKKVSRPPEEGKPKAVKKVPARETEKPKKPEPLPEPEAKKEPEPPREEAKPSKPEIETRAEEIIEQKTRGEAERIEPKKRVKLGLVSAVKSIITREVRIEEKDVRQMLDDLELELLEADVDLAVAGHIKEALGERMVGSVVGKGELHSFVSKTIREALVEILSNEKAFTIPERLENSEKPLKIMFLGINGAGKTTTIAKVAKMLLDRRKKVIFAAADTFRAAAIEQMGVHAERLGVKVIKRDYGSDPTSVAYDAVNYARAHGVDAVLIDTAGRQDTNISLMNEMKKMNRVIAPDIKIYIGESIAGNAIIEQINAFNREIGLDAVILTKLDCDPKGGTMLSINRATGIPIIYVGVGQAYDDLEEFEPERIVKRIVE